jgi:hypothetical protein
VTKPPDINTRLLTSVRILAASLQLPRVCFKQILLHLAMRPHFFSPTAAFGDDLMRHRLLAPKRWPVGAAPRRPGWRADGPKWEARPLRTEGLESHAGALGAWEWEESVHQRQRGCRKRRPFGGGWGATRRGRAINSRHLPAAPVRLSRSPLSAGPPLHLSRPRTAAPGARFATNGRHCRTTYNGSESFVPALVRPFVVRPTSPRSVRGFQFHINSPSNRPTV